MSTPDKELLWSQLNTKYGSTNSKSSFLSQKNFRLVVGIVAVGLAGKLIYEKLKEMNENGESVFDYLGDTSNEAILSSSAFGFMFVMVLKLTSDKVVRISENLNESTFIPIPTMSMPLIVSLVSAEAFELVVNKYVTPGAGKFEAGHVSGMLSAITLVGLFESFTR